MKLPFHKYALVMVALIGVMRPFGQVYSQSVTNWGVPVYGVQMSITTSNDVISSDSSFALECTAKNTSSNLMVYVYNPDFEMQIFMTDESGLTDNLSRDPNHFGPGGGGSGYTLRAGEVKVYTFPLTIKRNIKPGIYKFRTETPLRITIENTNHTDSFEYPKVVSNSLFLRVDH